jgi:heme-degrading monooxygenase HmoA
MILEHAVLNVRAGQARQFEEAMGIARALIEEVPGFHRMEVRPCIETKERYLLLVWWRSVEAHTQGIRGTQRYEKWRELLHHFYEPFPVVQHYGRPLWE